MEQPLHLYNSLSKTKEPFKALNPPNVGLYVCGPTVYGPPHLGHARPYITFDVLFRYLKHIGYKVRYVRNITDVGHLVNDADEGEDKIAKRAKVEQLEPMEIAQEYANQFHAAMDKLNIRRPSIEPLASGHIIEQIEMTQKILDNGYAYQSNGSVYFDVLKYAEQYEYGRLSGKVLDDMLSGSRQLDGQSEKRNAVDFALWKKAAPEHIMRWNSPWSVGFPGWHLECSVMSSKYLGTPFDIHGGGMDLQFPHHECEIAQSEGAHGQSPARYWMHNNMITLNGQKMGKSLGNAISLEEFFDGSHELLEQAYSPINIRFFMLQAHYRSTLDFSNEGLQAAEKGMNRLFAADQTLDRIQPRKETTFDLQTWVDKNYEHLNDDLNTAKVIANLFESVTVINQLADGKQSITADDLKQLKLVFRTFTFDILGLQNELAGAGDDDRMKGLIDMVAHIRQEARGRKDFATSDYIRDQLQAIGFTVKDGKDGMTVS